MPRWGWLGGATLATALSAALLSLPTAFSERCRAVVRDLTFPALRRLLPDVSAETRPEPVSSESTAALERQLTEATRQALYWQAVSARLQTERDEAIQQAGLPVASRGANPLLDADWISARLLSRGTPLPGWELPVINRGTDQTIAAGDLVAADGHLLLDVGTRDSVAIDSRVVAGRAVLGRIATAGQWTSTVQLVSDAGYRGAAQLVRQSGGAAVEGPEGVLVGLGTGRCSLQYVAATEPVRVGDLVVTPLRQPWGNGPLLYGTVTRADAAVGATHWSIDVEPLADLRKAAEVLVLTVQPNPRRVERGR